MTTPRAPLDAYDDLRHGQRARARRALDRDEATRQRARAEAHLAALGMPPAVPLAAPWSTTPPDGPNLLDTAGVDVLEAACAAAPSCPRCRARATPWQPPNGPRRYVCLGCGYDPDRPEAGA